MPSIEPRRAQKTCSICGSDLKPGAQLCNECHQYQTWPRRILASANFSGLATLVPIVALSVAFLNTQVFNRHSTIKASLVRCDTGAAVVALSNIGMRPAVLRGGTVVMDLQGKPTKVSRVLQATEENTRSVFLRPDDSQVTRLDFVSAPENTLLPIQEGSDNCTLRIMLDVIAFDHSEQHIPLTCSCPK